MKTFKEISERVKASGATQKALREPIDRGKAAHLKLKIKNVISDLDNIAWKLENQIDVGNKQRDVDNVVKEIDSIIPSIRKLDKLLKSTLNKLLK
jgi:hypothetical protein